MIIHILFIYLYSIGIQVSSYHYSVSIIISFFMGYIDVTAMFLRKVKSSRMLVDMKHDMRANSLKDTT